jgi:hypothetical protein
MIHYHPRGLDLRALAALCNERRDGDDRFAFDLDRPLQLEDSTGFYWRLWGTSRTGFDLCTQWPAPPDDGREDYRADLDRCRGIEGTNDPEVALDRLLELERRRAAAKENP